MVQILMMSYVCGSISLLFSQLSSIDHSKAPLKLLCACEHRSEKNVSAKNRI